MAKRHETKPAWDNVFVFDSVAGIGINCKADFAEAAILFQQPNHEQSIKWHYDGNGSHKEAVLTVSKSTGELNYEGGGVRVNGSVSAAQGLSGEATPAKNLRGKNVAVAKDAKSIEIKFAQPEVDGNYAVFIEQTWFSDRMVTNKGPKGFTVTFRDAAPRGATIDWIIVR